MQADEAKAKGNAAFQAQNYEEAIKHFTDGIELAPTNHVLYSNRSACTALTQQEVACLLHVGLDDMFMQAMRV